MLSVFRKGILLMGVLLIGSVNKSLACTCDIRPPACYEYHRTKTIFLGSVSSVSFPVSSPVEHVSVNVVENFLGMNSTTAETFNYRHSCAHTFINGEAYLFYGETETDKPTLFGTSLCTRTTEEKYAQADLEYLRAVKAGNSLYWIWGTISEIGYSPPLSGIRAEVLGIRPKLESVSDNEGNIKFDVGKPGKYRVRVHLPKGRGDINYAIRNERELWEENRKQIVGGRFRGNRPYVDYELNIQANRCGWFDVSIPRETVKVK